MAEKLRYGINIAVGQAVLELLIKKLLSVNNITLIQKLSKTKVRVIAQYLTRSKEMRHMSAVFNFDFSIWILSI